MTRLWANGVPITVQPGPAGEPIRFSWRGAWHQVETLCNRWRVQSTWWVREAAANREYFRLTTIDGLLVELYHDLDTGTWLLARLYD